MSCDLAILPTGVFGRKNFLTVRRVKSLIAGSRFLTSFSTCFCITASCAIIFSILGFASCLRIVTPAASINPFDIANFSNTVCAFCIYSEETAFFISWYSGFSVPSGLYLNLFLFPPTFPEPFFLTLLPMSPKAPPLKFCVIFPLDSCFQGTLPRLCLARKSPMSPRSK